jgi:hypothetical protein
MREGEMRISAGKTFGGAVAVERSAVDAPAREHARRRVVRLIFLVYWLLIFDGVLRKWVFPEFHQILYFLRDPFVLVIYLYAIRYNLFYQHVFLSLFVVFGLLASVLAFLAYMISGINMLVLLIGIRNYFLYLPLAFVVARCVRMEDMALLTRRNLLIALPVALLVLAQYLSPPSAFINRGISEDDAIALVVTDMVRPYGTFTYASGHVLYVGALIAMLAAAWLQRKQMRISPGLLAVGGTAILCMSLTTGSRSIYFVMMLIGLSLAVVSVSTPGAGVRARALLFPVLFLAGAAALFTSVLEPAYQAMLERQASAVQSEGSTLARAFSGLYGFLRMIPEAPALGYGLGAGTSAGAAFATGMRQFTLAEDEWQRIMLELGPLFGLVFIGLRVAFVGWLGARALLSNRRLDNPTALVLFGFAGITVLNGPLTLNVMTASFAWLFVGLILAASDPSNQFATEARVRPRREPRAFPAPGSGRASKWPADRGGSSTRQIARRPNSP